MNTLFATTNWFSIDTPFGVIDYANTVEPIWQQYVTDIDLLSARVMLAPDVAVEIDAVTYASQTEIITSGAFQDGLEPSFDTYAFSGEAEILGTNAQLDLSAFEAILSPLAEVVDEGGFVPVLSQNTDLTTILSEDTDSVDITTLDPAQFTADAIYMLEITYIEDVMTGFEYASISDIDGGTI